MIAPKQETVIVQSLMHLTDLMHHMIVGIVTGVMSLSRNLNQKRRPLDESFFYLFYDYTLV